MKSSVTGHSGMASQKMFTDLEQLREGDIFYLQFNVENCHYLKVISGGESEYVKQSADGTFQFTIPAYDGVFVIPLIEN